MIGLKVWENPLVTSAFRVKYRRSAPMYVVSLYLMLTVGGAMLIKFYEHALRLPTSWEKMCFILLLCLQFVLSCIIAMASTHTSINNDVINRTFDFQRIAALPPRQILLGKLFGEPAIAFLLIFASIPMMVWCATLGATTASVLFLSIVNLFSMTLFAGTIGMIHTLETNDRKKASGGNPVAGAILFFIFVVPWFISAMANIGGAMGNRWASAAVGLLTPVGFIYGLAIDDVWGQGLTFFSLNLPYLIVTPIAQLMVGLLIFRAMCHRIVTPVMPLLSKPMAYGLVLGAEVLVAGLQYDTAPGAMTVEERAVVFCAVHVGVSLVVTLAATASRECLMSWVWRFRGKRSRLADLLIGERTHNLGMALGFGLMGLVCLWAGVIGPAIWSGQVNPDYPWLAGISLACLLLPLTHAALFQMLIAVVGRSGALACILLGAIYFITPVIVDVIYKFNYTFRSITPLGHLIGAFDKQHGPLTPLPMFLLYSAALLLAIIWLRRWLQCYSSSVDNKLQEMGVTVANPIHASGGAQALR